MYSEIRLRLNGGHMSLNLFFLISGIIALVAFAIASVTKQIPRAHAARPLIPTRYSLPVAFALFAIGLALKFWQPLHENTYTARRESDAPSITKSDGWSTVSIPPRGWSPVYSRPNGEHMISKGAGYLLYNVYKDNNKCPATSTCPDNSRGTTFENLTDDTVIVTFRFESD